MRKTLCALLGSLALSGCIIGVQPGKTPQGGESHSRGNYDGGSDGSQDASITPDGSSPQFMDAGHRVFVDAGLDAGQAYFSDAGGRDFDAGEWSDSGVVDAGREQFDAGTSPDAGAPDAGGAYLPFTADSHCLALFHFDNTNPLQNECSAVYGVQDYGTESREGRFGQARHFNGTSYLSGPGNMTLDLGDAITVEAWVKPESGGGGNIFHTMYADVFQTGSGEGWQGFALIATENVVGFYLGVNNRRLALETNNLGARTDRFTHIVGAFDGINGKLYLDGELVVERENPGSITKIPYGSVYFGIGADRNGGGAFRGSIDEVRISNIARY